MKLFGHLFEIGPDGYGYLVDGNKNYPFYKSLVTNLSEEESTNPMLLEGRKVQYSLGSDDHVQDAMLV